MTFGKTIPAIAVSLPLLLATSVQAEILDDFNNSTLDTTTLWTTGHSGGGQSFTSPSPDYGTGVLRAPNGDMARAAIYTKTTRSQLNFFNAGFTIGVTGFQLSNENLADDLTYFRLGLCSTAARQFSAPDSLALRLDKAGNVLFGYKIDKTNSDAESRNGAGTPGLEEYAYTGVVSALSLSLSPRSIIGGLATIDYAITLNGSAGEHVTTGSFSLLQTDWNATGDSALTLEVRRQMAGVWSGEGNSEAKAKFDAITYDLLPVPEPSSFALLGLGLALVLGRKRIQS
jgi:hypothetical protein